MNIRDIDWRAKLRPLYRFATKLPRGVRSLAGLVLIAAGFVGIVMPLLGSWMAPLGLMFIAADIPPLRKRVDRWFEGGGEPDSARPTYPGLVERNRRARIEKPEPRRAAR